MWNLLMNYNWRKTRLSLRLPTNTSHHLMVFTYYIPITDPTEVTITHPSSPSPPDPGKAPYLLSTLPLSLAPKNSQILTSIQVILQPKIQPHILLSFIYPFFWINNPILSLLSTPSRILSTSLVTLAWKILYSENPPKLQLHQKIYSVASI